MGLRFVVPKLDRTGRPVGTETAVDHVFRIADFDEIDHMGPAAVRMGFVGIGPANPGPSHVTVKAETVEDVVVELIYFHAVAATIGILTCRVWKNDFVEKMIGRNVDDMMPRVVLGQIFPRDFDEVVFLKEVQV
jgi:hypothetical protein